MLLVDLSQNSNSANKYISNTLLKEIDKYISKKKKIILYLNKRWNYSSLICEDCQYLYECKNCDVSLNIHSSPEKLLCHICSYELKIQLKCIKCNWNKLKKIWVWTQQIEHFLKKYFKNNKINIFRFDTDVIKNKSDKTNAIDNLKKADIIIWTKMITTWFDFRNIWLIWVILLEQELQIPKYNTKERIYSNIKQLIWRWSRNWEHTEIIIQTFIPKNDIIISIINDNYKDFFTKTLIERKLFNYPPYNELIIIEYRHSNKEKAYNFLLNINNKLNIENNNKNINLILSPTPIRKHNQYHYNLILKWNNLRNFIKCIKLEIMRNKWLIVIFE